MPPDATLLPATRAVAPLSRTAARRRRRVPRGLIALAVLAALAPWALVLATLHAALGRAMRARGLRWRVRDTLLVSPLFVLGTLACTGGLAWALAHGAWAGARGSTVLVGDVASAVALALAGAVVSAFGIRAVGKLY